MRIGRRAPASSPRFTEDLMGDHKRTRRSMWLTTLVTVALLAAPPVRALPQTPGTGAASGVTILRFGKLWDGSKVMTDAVVVVEGDRVKSVGSGNAAVPPNAKVIDLSKYYGIPGMIDAHTHITYWADATPQPGVRPLQTSMGLPTAVRVFM